MKRFLQIVLLLLVIVLIAIVTKPSEENCKSKAVDQVVQSLENKTHSENLFGEAFVKNMAAKTISIQDKFLYHEIHYSFRENSRTIGYGLFGFVYLKDL